MQKVEPEMEIWCNKGMLMLKVVSSENNLWFNLGNIAVLVEK